MRPVPKKSGPNLFTAKAERATASEGHALPRGAPRGPEYRLRQYRASRSKAVAEYATAVPGSS
eukprot:2655163-Rhodomonas_salina.1